MYMLLVNLYICMGKVSEFSVTKRVSEFLDHHLKPIMQEDGLTSKTPKNFFKESSKYG